MEPLSRLLPKTLNRLGLAEHASASLVVHRAQAWIREYLPQCADSVHVRSVEGTTLIIACNHPIAAQEVRQVTLPLLAFLATHSDAPAPQEARITRS